MSELKHSIKNLEDLTEEDIALLNTKVGLRNLFGHKKVDVRRALRYTKYEVELKRLQAELVDAQNWIIENNQKVIVLFEGRDAAGKGGAIRRITAHINPRYFRKIALPKPTEVEQLQWYFQRYINHFPQPGEIIFFDRSWYNRAVVEPVNGFCTPEQYQTFMGQVNEFERMIVESNVHFIKIYLSISKDEQERRFNDIKRNPLKRWKMTPVDERAQELWDEYTKYKEKMFEHTNTKLAPWKVIDANRKTNARLESLRYMLDQIPYKKV